MSLLGAISTEPLHVRVSVANGRGWGCIVRDSDGTWRLPAFRGGKGAVAVHPSSQRWVLFSSEGMRVLGEREACGEVVVEAAAPVGAEPCLRLGTPWVVAYEGTIGDVVALQAALDPTWAGNPALQTPGDLICAHVFTYLAGVGALYASDVALAHASRGIRRARRLGSAAFLCSNGDRLYACASGLPLVIASLAGAMVVGSPDILPSGAALSLPDGAVVSLSRHPHLAWSTRLVEDE